MAEQAITTYNSRKRGTLFGGIVDQRLNTPAGYMLVMLMAVTMGLIVGIGGLVVGVVALGAAIGIPFLILFALNIKIGSIALFFFAFTILGLKRFIEQVPVGIVLDAVSVALVFGLLIEMVKTRDYSLLYTSVGIALGFWVVYNVLQVFNPNAASQMAWVYTVRSFALITLFYYVLAYALDDMRFVYIMIGLWLVIAVLGAFYAYIQEYVGLRGFEYAWLAADEALFGRLLQWGVIRKWSFFSDPMVFGFLMSYTGIACAILAMGPYPRFVKVMLILAIFPLLHSMLFSGTRAAYLLPPAAAAFFVLTRLSLKTIVAGAILGGALLVVINMPTDNVTILRFQSAFEPEDDASYEVRQQNLAFIKPFIQQNPLGGGLGSTGIWGQRFSPDSPLAQFPPDSGFVRIAVEIGWIGLVIYTVFLMITLYVGIKHYFLMRDPAIRNVQLTMLIVIISLIVGNFPQEAITSPPNNVVFLFAVAVVANLYRLDPNYGGLFMGGDDYRGDQSLMIPQPEPPIAPVDPDELEGQDPKALPEPLPTFSVEPELEKDRIFEIHHKKKPKS